MTKLGRWAAAALIGSAVPAAAQDAGTVVATVNGTDITLGHMAALRQDLPPRFDELPPEAIYDSILEQLIQQQAVGDEAGEPAAYVRLALDNQRRALLSSQFLAEKVEAEVTDAAIEEEYRSLYEEREPQTEFDASHILVETEEEAQDLVTQLEEGADFATLARAESTGPSGPNGGALGWFGPGAMVPAFDAAVQEMEVGEIAGPVETQFGWHVIRLNDRRTSDAPALDEVRDEVARSLQEQVISGTVDEVMAEADVDRPDVGIDPSILTDQSLLD